MFSFYKLVEALDQLHEEISGDVGIPNSSGVSASGAINPPENPAKGKKKELLLSPVKPEEEKPEEIAKVQEVSKWQKMFPKLSAKAAKRLTPLSTEKGIKLVKRMTSIPAHAYGMAEGEEPDKVQEIAKWQKMSSKLSPKAAVKLLPLSTEKGIKLVKRMIQKPEHAHGLATRLRKLWIK